MFKVPYLYIKIIRRKGVVIFYVKKFVIFRVNVTLYVKSCYIWR